jgi:transposase
VFQHIDQLGYAEADEAVLARLDWKYALVLEIDASGFDATILGDFRTRLLAAGAEERLSSAVL